MRSGVFPADYPMVAPAYAEARSRLAKKWVSASVASAANKAACKHLACSKVLDSSNGLHFAFR